MFGYGTPYLIENQLLYALFCFSRFTTKYVSPQLIKSEMQSVNNSESAIEDLMVSSSTVQMIQQSGMEFQVISEVVTCQSVWLPHSFYHEVLCVFFLSLFHSLPPF